MKEYLNRVFNSILSNPDLSSLGEGIPQLFVQQAKSVVLMHRYIPHTHKITPHKTITLPTIFRAVEKVQRRLSKTLEDVRTRLFRYHPILSRIGPWLRSRLRAAEQKFSIENQWSAHEEALTLCNAEKLSQTVYFLNRDLAFMKEVSSNITKNVVLFICSVFFCLKREPALLRELKNVKTPTRSFLWPTQIWLPTNWIVRRNFQGQSEVVPTVLSKQATSITTPRSDPSQPVSIIDWLCRKLWVFKRKNREKSVNSIIF